MAICNRCQEPVGLIHRCKPAVVSNAPPRSAEDLARYVFMMADAGYSVDPTVMTLSKGLLDMRKLLKDYIAELADNEGVYFTFIYDERQSVINKIIEELKDEDDVKHGRKTS
jgi:hypothetical protein